MGIRSDAILCILNEDIPDRKIVIRMSGSDYVLVEYGEARPDIAYRVRIYWLEKLINDMQVKGVRELSPGVRSVLIYYDSLILSVDRLIEVIRIAEKQLAGFGDVPVPSRSVKMPIAFHDKKCLDHIQKYMGSIRSEAPYLPDNMEFVARCNGLASIKQVEEYFLATEHLVMGLGDVYLGAPCAIPLDPRYRLSAPKYNPARTMTPEGAIGIGGSFMCIYPMESPGGYQLIGRTVPFWDTWQLNDAFKEAPWLLRPFDRIQFLPVSEEELDEMCSKVHSDQYHFEITEDRFDLKEYEQFCTKVASETAVFRKQQAKAIVSATQGY